LGRLEVELKALGEVLAARPAIAPLPAVEQLLRQRNELQAQIDSARAIMVPLSRTVDWGSVVRAAAAGNAGLAVTQLKTMPPEQVFSPSMIKPPSTTPRGNGGAPAAPPAPAPVPLDGVDSIYRHRAELTVRGDFAALMGYLQTLQQVPGDLRWDKLQLTVAAYPQATVQLSLYTLSSGAETPFN
jgi:MSHA biogenesis protein MshJ